MRLQKFLADAGVASRRSCETFISQGRVSVNGEVVTQLGSKVNPLNDKVRFDGERIRPPKTDHCQYYVMNKPKSVVTTMRDPQGRPTVNEYLPARVRKSRLFPVGRLDYDVTGCLLFTNDGEMAHRLMHPKYGVERVYRVKVRGRPTEKSIRRLETLAGRTRIGAGRKLEDASWWTMTLYEGRHHQVKKLWDSIGHPVMKLTRMSYAGIRVTGVASGSARALTPSEVKHLRNVCQLR